MIELKLYFILDQYLNLIELSSLITNIRGMKKDENNRKSSDFESKHHEEGVSLGQVTLKIFKVLRQKKSSLLKKYQNILQYLPGWRDFVPFNELIYIC